MTLEEAIAEVKRATNYGPWQVGDIGGQANNPLAHEIVRVLQAAASGDLIPLAKLGDPVAVHLNMVRGTIAKPTIGQIIHLYGVDALCKALAPMIVQDATDVADRDRARAEAAEAEVAQLREALEFYADLSAEGPWHLPGEDYGKRARATLDAYKESKK